ncbi:hypothetical protein BC628DRAFT_1487398 [Trametes gibbosa]|nr:hypothetical protein BC628DRAFT_1487398 [Trametes gibbosa]
MQPVHDPICTPFDDDDADVIFRSCDGVEFRLYKNVAAKASSVFRDMFTLPHQSEHISIEPLGTPQILWERLFRLCYPVPPPKFSTIDDVRVTLAAATKYMMHALVLKLEDALLQILSVESRRVYALAYLFRMGDVTRRAAKVLREDPSFAELNSLPPKFDELPARALHAAQFYRRSCAEAAVGAIWHENGSWMNCGPRRAAPVGFWIWEQCTAHQVQPGTTIVSHSLRSRTQWWWLYINSLTAALYKRPDPRLATDMSLIEPPVAEANKCRKCRKYALRDMLEFGRFAQRIIEDAVAEVVVKLPF